MCEFKHVFVSRQVCVCVCVFVFSIQPSPHSLQKTKTTAVKGIIPRGKSRKNAHLSHTHKYTHLVVMFIQKLSYSCQRLVYSLFRWISCTNTQITSKSDTQFTESDAVTDLLSLLCTRIFSHHRFSLKIF